MMRMIPVLLLSVLTAVALPAQVPAKAAKTTKSDTTPSPSDQERNIQAYVQLLRTDLKKSKAQVIGDVMQFDANQAAAFWPIYKEFETEFSAVGDQVVQLVKDYAANYDTMTNDVADQLAVKLLDIEQQKTALKRKYYERFKNALDAITATRFLQVENQIEKLVDLQIASQLPVVSGPGK